MKKPLDNQNLLVQLDPKNVYASITSLGSQFESGWHESQFVSINLKLEKIKNIIYVGMGGSGLPAHIVLSISPYLLTCPFELVSNYRLPLYANQDTLVILASYSGNTEEVMSCAQDAKLKKCKIITITTGGQLKNTSQKEHWPLVQLDHKLNPSLDPRYGICSLLGAVLGLLTRINPESRRHFDTTKILQIINTAIEKYKLDVHSDKNPAKQFALKNKGKAIIFISANHLTGVAKLSANHINETAKTFSSSFSLPDVNHHLLDGLSFPTSFKDSVRFVLINSSFYPQIIQKRLTITKDILIKIDYQLTVIKPETEDVIHQVFESLVFFIIISYYLSIINKQDPGSNDWVDFLKKEL